MLLTIIVWGLALFVAGNLVVAGVMVYLVGWQGFLKS